MRTTLLGSLLDAARGNLARGAGGVALFESGRIHLPEAGDGAGEGPMAGSFPGERPAPFREPHRLACLLVGPLEPATWRGGGEGADFFALKGVLEALAGGLGAEVAVEPGDEPFLHPGRCGRVGFGGGGEAGWIGEVHPLVCRSWDLESAIAFEVGLSELIKATRAGEEVHEDVTTFPAVIQDIAAVVAEETPAAEVVRAVREGGGELLRSARVFDLYRGEQLGEGRKSLALRLEFRAADRTLTDDEVAGLRGGIEARLREIGGSLRE